MTISEITSLNEIVERLVVFGGAVAPREMQKWLFSCGIARPAPGQHHWLVPTLPYLRSVLPAKDRQDLFRKTMIRNPRYRLHLDLSLARVLQIIAKSERWTRFEELAFGTLSPVSQRLLSLLEWVADYSGQPANGLGDVHWSRFESEVCGDSVAEFQSFDTYLWGYARDAADLFPLIEDLYLPLIGQPVYFDLVGKQAQVVASLVEAARADDAVILLEDDLIVCDDLRRSGLPVLRRPGSQLCSLTAKVELSVTETVETLSAQMKSATLGVPSLARQSDLQSATAETSWLRSTGAKSWTSCATFLSVCPDSNKWPDSSIENVPPWTRLPESNALSDVALLKRKSGLEDAVISLDRHALYGLLLQILISEALDRELGDETILLAPPLDKVGHETEWGTSVLYRPSSKSDSAIPVQSAGYLSLGSLDFVMDRVARQLTSEVLPLPYCMPGYGLWSWGFHLLIDLKVVIGQRDRWTLSPTLHDSLYTGHLMAQVLRDRREIRQAIHHELHQMWKDAANSVVESQMGKEVTV